MPDSRSLDVILKNFREGGQAMLMSVKVGQKFIMNRIRGFCSYDSCPEAMASDPDTELAFSSVTWNTRSSQPTDGRRGPEDNGNSKGKEDQEHQKGIWVLQCLLRQTHTS